MSEVLVRCEKQQCKTRYALTLDALGRLTGSCPSCARRRQGICQTCPSPVDGMTGRAKWCKACRVVEHRNQCNRYRRQDIVKYNERAAARIRAARAKAKQGQPPTDWQEVVARRTRSRSAALTPAQRSAITSKASKARWRRYYQRQMLRQMREQQEVT